MNAALLIGHNDLRLFLRNRSSLIWLFAVPVMFVYFMGFANRGPGGPASASPAVLVENHDTGFLGASFLDALGAQGLRILAPTNAADARRGVRVPPDFSANILSGRQGTVEFFSVAGSGDAAAALVELRVVRALIALNSDLIELGTADANAPPTADAVRALQQRPPAVELRTRHAGRKPIPAGFNFSLPGVLVMYVLMNLLIFGGTTVASERQSGVLRRLTVHPMSRSALIAGKVYGLMLLAAVQVAVLLLAGRFLFHVNFGDSLGGIVVVMLVYSWVASSLGVLVGSLVRAEDKVIGICILASLVMAALGGCWWPLEVVPDFARILAHSIPTGWAMDALNRLITFGGGLADATLPLAMLAGFGLAANGLAARFFRA